MFLPLKNSDEPQFGHVSCNLPFISMLCHRIAQHCAICVRWRMSMDYSLYLQDMMKIKQRTDTYCAVRIIRETACTTRDCVPPAEE